MKSGALIEDSERTVSGVSRYNSYRKCKQQLLAAVVANVLTH